MLAPIVGFSGCAPEKVGVHLRKANIEAQNNVLKHHLHLLELLLSPLYREFSTLAINSN